MHKLLAFSLLPSLLAAQGTSFSPADAVRAEWDRQAPLVKVADLPRADQVRLELTLKRIGTPGAPELLPLGLLHPTLEIWEKKAAEAKSPRDRFTALYFLNRLKSPKALGALEGLDAEAAKGWPKHLHLEAQIATARLNGGEVSPALQGFLDGLEKVGKVDPVRAQAARLRLVMAGKEKELLPAIKTTPGSLLALLDALNRSSDSSRVKKLLAFFSTADLLGKDLPGPWNDIGLASAPARSPVLIRKLGAEVAPEMPYRLELLERLGEGLPADSSIPSENLTYFLHYSGSLGEVARAGLEDRVSDHKQWLQTMRPTTDASLLPALRKIAPGEADSLRAKLLASPSPIARAAAIDDLPTAPADLEALAKRCYQDTDLESALELFSSLDRWKLSPEQQKAVLTPFFSHPDWGWRYQAWVQLRKTDPTAPWPSAPPERPMDKALLAEATRLAERGKPVRLRITFSGHRIVTLRLDPTVAPMNVANLVLLARKRFFDGHRVPRVVPDFVVQMGSPYDTMDGGPGYSVRCEDSLTWYGPGSVGMALAGKDTGGCQFFITTNATPHLTGKYTRMGEVENPDHDLKILDELELGAKIETIRIVE